MKSFASDITDIPDDNFDTDCSSGFDLKIVVEDSCSETDENFSDSSADSNESENSFSIQDVRQCFKIDMQNVPPVPALFPFLGNPGSNLSLWQMMQLF